MKFLGVIFHNLMQEFTAEISSSAEENIFEFYVVRFTRRRS